MQCFTTTKQIDDNEEAHVRMISSGICEQCVLEISANVDDAAKHQLYKSVSCSGDSVQADSK